MSRAEIAGQQHRRAGGGDVSRLLGDDGIGDFAVFHGEGAAEAAARVGLVHLDEFEPLDAGEQLARLALHAEFAQARAGIVIGGPADMPGAHARHAAHVDEKAGQLMRLVGEGLRALRQHRLVGEQLGIMFGHHAAAGAGRRDDIVAARKGVDDLQGQIARRAPVSRVEGRLTAAGLRRHDDLAARVLDQLGGGETDAWPHQVDKTGGEQANHGFSVGRRHRAFHPAKRRPPRGSGRIVWRPGRRVNRRPGQCDLI
jgi:hypothetical protein